MKRRCRGLLVLVVALSSVTAHAWDAAGHMLVDQIAWDVMTPAARQRATELLKPLDTRFSEGQVYHFVTGGCWMDDMRGLGKEYSWSRLHYVTIPWTPSGHPAELPPPPHIVSAITDSIHALENRQESPARQTEALAMLLHFIGDLHQPLHTTDRNDDRGGNGVLIAGVPFSDLMSKQGRNLHTFWDKAFRFTGQGSEIVEMWMAPLLAERPSAPDEGIMAERAKKIVAQYPREKLPELQTARDAAAWARESHVIGCLSGYPAGDFTDPSEIHVLTPAFATKSQEIASRRIALAGYRLGALLNSLLGR